MLEQTNFLPALICHDFDPTQIIADKWVWLTSSTNNGRVGGAEKRMRAVDGKQEINLEWSYKCTGCQALLSELNALLHAVLLYLPLWSYSVSERLG